MFDITSDLENWLTYDVTDHELIRNGYGARVTLALNANESGMRGVNPDDWALTFEIALTPNHDPDFLRDLEGKLNGKAIGPVWLVCEPH